MGAMGPFGREFLSIMPIHFRGIIERKRLVWTVLIWRQMMFGCFTV